MAIETRTWEQVLADVEADAERAAALLVDSVDDLVPAPPLVLPALADMPSVPEHLRERIEGLRARIDTLQAELVLALREWQCPPQLSSVSTFAAPQYLDRLV